MRTEDEILDLLYEAAEQASHWVSVGDFLKRHIESQNDPLVPFVFAFHYYYVEPERKDIRQQRGPFAPILEIKDETTYPPLLDTLDEKIVSAWGRVVWKISHPTIVSRLADLLWILKRGNRPDKYARSAAEAYLSLSGITSWDSIYKVEGLPRALEIARELNDKRLLENVTYCLVEATELALDSDKDASKPGVALRFIAALLRLPRQTQPPEVDMLLKQSADLYDDKPFHKESIFMLIAKRLDNDEDRRVIHKKIVEEWIQAAENATGLQRMAYYQHALELARNFGLSDLLNELRALIQEFPVQDTEFHSISTTVSIPADYVERTIDAIVIERDWRTSLTRFGAYGPPSGNYDSNLSEIRKLMQRYPIQFLVSRVVFDDLGFPILVAQSEDTHTKVALSQHEMMGIMIFGELLAKEILDRIYVSHKSLHAEELTEFFTTPLIDPEIAERIACAILEYWQGRYDESAHILVPRVETVIRSIAREIGIAIYREPVGGRPGGVLPLGELLGKLKGYWEDESWRRYFVNLLVDPLGVNLRNRIAHGLVTKVTQTESALLIHAICHLRLIHISLGEGNA